MTAPAGRRRPGPVLAPGGGVGLFLAIGALSFAASLIVIAALAGARGATDWRERFVGSATVVVRGAGLESPEAAAARAAEVLQGMGGVARAWPLDAARNDRIIARLEDGKTDAAGAPRLVAVQFKAGRAPAAAALARALGADGLDAAVDDHRLGSSQAARAAALAGLAAAGLLAAIVAAMGAFAAFAARRRIAARIETVDLLRLAGAADGYIGALFAADAARAAAWGGAAGGAAAALAAAAWRLAGPVPGLPAGAFSFAGADLASAAVWPLIAAAAGALAARLAVRAALIGAP